MLNETIQFESVVIGGGHAGIEAALACSRMGCRTALVTLSRATIGAMSCNPSIGGVGKGQLVREVDVLGGEIGLAADFSSVQFRQLNASKGKAVRSSRCQSDRKLYAGYMQHVIERQDNLTLIEDMADEILVRNSRVQGVRIASGKTLKARTVVMAAGTFLNGRIHIGRDITVGGRINEPSSIRLTKNLADLGFTIVDFKTGTPPRLHRDSIDFSRMERQDSDAVPVPFSFRGGPIEPGRRFLPCYITHTTDKTHAIIRSNFHMSPMYSGQINATGVRYCPSIEDKLKKFPDKVSHHVFLEPEGFDTPIYYPNGISTGLPRDVQSDLVHSIPGLEQAVVTRPGYSIEHAMIPPTSLKASLETKAISGLFFAGQVNGSTGYEEAAAQGIMAGINAALKIRKAEPFVLGRHESYIGVLIDDLVTKGTEEPYRMFTSRVEYRLVIREDNTDRRLAGYGYQYGLLSRKDFDKIQLKYDRIKKEIRHLRSRRIYPSTEEGHRFNQVLSRHNSSCIRQPALLSDILKRPEIRYSMITAFDGSLKELPDEIIEQIEYEIKYEGFIQRQLKDIKKFRHIEGIKIPTDIDYDRIHGLSIEIRQKLRQAAPATLGQAERISGITPAAISILMVYLKKLSLVRKRQRQQFTGEKTK